MTIWQAALLGVVQGLTEFLPVSSSGHLVLLQQLFGIHQSTLTFDVAIHLGTLVAILIFFGMSLLKVTRREWVLVAIGTIPAVIVGVVFKDQIEALFANDRFVGLELIISGFINFYADRKLNPKLQATKAELKTEPSWKDSILIGLAQAVAIVPGISRSGSTVASGLSLGISREQAFRFSFLLAIPALLGAGVLEAVDILQTGAVDVSLAVLGVGTLAALVSGLLSLRLFRYVIDKAKLDWFGWYCLVLGLVVLVVQFS